MKLLILNLAFFSSVCLADLVPGGSGSPASFPSGVLGKTDGVAIPPGEVGELISYSATTPNWSTSTFNMAQLTLTPGVWLLSGSAYMGSIAGTARLTINITNAGPTADGLVEEGTQINSDYATTNGAGSITISNVYVNISSTETWYMNGKSTDTTGNSSSGYHFQAVRIR